jgi:hypothetical protein
MSDFGAAVDAYRAQARSGGGALEADALGLEPAALLDRSQAIEDAAAEALLAGDGDVREAGALQLAAGAALDLAAALDAVEPQVASALEAETTATNVERVFAELGDILGIPSALGARAAVPERPNSALEAGEEPLVALAAAAERAIDRIAGDARDVAGSAVRGIADLPVDALLGALGDTADKLLGPVYRQAAAATRVALRHLAKAVSKLLRILGPLEAPARTWLGERLVALPRERLVDWAVDGVLELDRLRAEVGVLVGRATTPGDEARLDAATREVAALADRFGLHAKVARTLAWAIGKLQRFLLGLAGWVGFALAGVYLLMLTYGVFVAGDHLDWYRTGEGRLDFTLGVRGTVRLAVA